MRATAQNQPPTLLPCFFLLMPCIPWPCLWPWAMPCPPWWPPPKCPPCPCPCPSSSSTSSYTSGFWNSTSSTAEPGFFFFFLSPFARSITLQRNCVWQLMNIFKQQQRSATIETNRRTDWTENNCGHLSITTIHFAQVRKLDGRQFKSIDIRHRRSLLAFSQWMRYTMLIFFSYCVRYAAANGELFHRHRCRVFSTEYC